MIKPFKGSAAAGFLGLLLSIIALATQEWTKTPDVSIGLWAATDADGITYSWMQTGVYEEFFFSTYFMATRALVLAGFILGVLGLFFNIYAIVKNPRKGGTVLFVYYLLSYCLLVSAAAMYCSIIPQGVTSDGSITTNKDMIVEYIYIGYYGFSLWFCWISSGLFLLASGIAYEGSNQQELARKFDDFVNA